MINQQQFKKALAASGDFKLSMPFRVRLHLIPSHNRGIFHSESLASQNYYHGNKCHRESNDYRLLYFPHSLYFHGGLSD
jgi:hypothetical protein